MRWYFSSSPTSYQLTPLCSVSEEIYKHCGQYRIEAGTTLFNIMLEVFLEIILSWRKFFRNFPVRNHSEGGAISWVRSVHNRVQIFVCLRETCDLSFLGAWERRFCPRALGGAFPFTICSDRTGTTARATSTYVAVGYCPSRLGETWSRTCRWNLRHHASDNAKCKYGNFWIRSTE